MTRKHYLYHPGLMDACTPTVLRGNAIARGSVVTVSRKLRPRMLPPCFVVIQDKNKNTQIVWKAALVKQSNN